MSSIKGFLVGVRNTYFDDKFDLCAPIRDANVYFYFFTTRLVSAYLYLLSFFFLLIYVFLVVCFSCFRIRCRFWRDGDSRIRHIFFINTAARNKRFFFTIKTKAFHNIYARASNVLLRGTPTFNISDNSLFYFNAALKSKTFFFFFIVSTKNNVIFSPWAVRRLKVGNSTVTT